MVRGYPTEQYDVACQTCPVGATGIYEHRYKQNPADIARLRRAVRRIPSGRIFAQQGDEIDEVHMVYAGWACRFLQLPDGRRQILHFILPGDVAAPERIWISDGPLPFSLKALTDIVVCIFEREDVKRLLDSDTHQLKSAHEKVHQLWTRIFSGMTDLGRRSARGRIAQLFIDLESRLTAKGLASGGGFFCPLRQEHIADATGLTPVHVSRMLNEFRKEQILRIENQELVVLDRDALLRAGDQ